jgi:DNA-binding response OmpR family regulator
VLVVDDARFFREMIKEMLQELPIRLVLAADGHEAWQQISALSPQLVLLDLNIPGKSGKEIVQELRQSTGNERVKVLAMSGIERGAEVASEMRQIGADDFINKSFTPRELQDRVRKLLDL